MAIQTIIKLLLLCCLFNLFQLTECIVGGRKSKKPPVDDPVVFINYVGRYARVEGLKDRITGLYSFKGMRYADPPINENRFLRPKYRRLTGDVNATRNGPPCPQPDYYNERNIIGNEDCLTLNVFTPKMPDETSEFAGLPVLLFIHGGGYRTGSAAQYYPEPLTQNDIIFVPVQYRLGTLGILGDGTKEFGGNVALFDITAALRWIKEYITFFGGDPSQIKVIGHGSGAQAAMHLSNSRMGRSALSGIVAMSGSALSQYSYDKDSKETVLEVAKCNDCVNTNETELLKCLRSKSAEDIIKNDSDLQSERLDGENLVKSLSALSGFTPTLENIDDDRSLPGMIVEKPELEMIKEPQNKMPLLIGCTQHETANGLNEQEIKKIFKSGTNFLKSVQESFKVSKLTSINSIVGAFSAVPGIPSLAEYLAIPENLDPIKFILKVTEATTDVFFNIPLMLTSQLWSKYAPAFFYQFEHFGNVSAKSGKLIYNNLPITSKSTSQNLVAHGDELGYLFEICDIYGEPLIGSEIKTDRDKNARKNFVDLIVKFAYFNGSLSEGLNVGDLKAPLQGKDSSFISIKDVLNVGNDFRFCEMSIWGMKINPSQKISCDSVLKKVEQVVAKVPGVNKLSNFG